MAETASAAGSPGRRPTTPLRVHSSSGFALEFPEFSRVLCDARILNIFEGAAEIPGPRHRPAPAGRIELKTVRFFDQSSTLNLYKTGFQTLRRRG